MFDSIDEPAADLYLRSIRGWLQVVANRRQHLKAASKAVCENKRPERIQKVSEWAKRYVATSGRPG